MDPEPFELGGGLLVFLQPGLGGLDDVVRVTTAQFEACPQANVVSIVLAYPPKENLLIAENIPLDIIYEDQTLLVVNKPAGMVVHPGHGNPSGTLVNGLIYHIENLPKNSNERPGLVHRIDKDTSGLLVVAKTDFAM